MRVAVIEDDPEIMDIVTMAFETAWPGSQVLGASNATEGMQLVKRESPDVVILDVGLPEGDSCGYDLCKELRSTSDVPIIMLTARSREVDIVRGLELGAADYLTKPFSPIELLARTRAVMRRVQVGPLRSEGKPFISKEISVDFDTREVAVQGEPTKLTPTEYKMLCYLIRNPRQVLTNQAILDEVWGDDYRCNSGLVKAHVQRLRKKLKDNLQDPKLIITERGRGYRWAGVD
ncbi:MAG: response regulator transcription factor [Chloroflexi bacterium]|nr:response regulator transcription factor [Chloroflexota bacterium]MDA1218433.1 response regulator transcription factor [Chloroflexota bacterium]